MEISHPENNEKTKPRSEAYWISPKGEILAMGDSKHISLVIDKPESFGYSNSDIELIYKKHNEKIGQEGRAREEILLDLIKKEWIRIRRYTRPDCWTVNIPDQSDKVKDILQCWASRMISLGYSRYDDVFLDLQMDRKHFSMEELSRDALYTSEGRDIPEKRFQCSLIDSIHDLE